MKPTHDNNFGRVFELPSHYPEGFCFSGAKPVQFAMVDWFNPWPNGIETWEECRNLLLEFLTEKIYVKPGRKYILITDFGESLIFSLEDKKNVKA